MLTTEGTEDTEGSCSCAVPLPHVRLVDTRVRSPERALADAGISVPSSRGQSLWECSVIRESRVSAGSVRSVVDSVLNAADPGSGTAP